MEKFGAIGSKVTAFGAIDKLRFVIDALDLLREQAEAYAKRLEDVDTGIREDIGKRLNAIDRTYLPVLREAKKKIADVKVAAELFVDALETLFRSVLSTSTYRKRLKEEVRELRKKKDSEEQDNHSSQLESYRKVIVDSLSATYTAQKAWEEARKDAEVTLDKIPAIIQPLKRAVEQFKLDSNEKVFFANVRAVGWSAVCVGSAVGLVAAGVAIASAPCAAVVCAGLGIAAGDLSTMAIGAAVVGVVSAFKANDIWKRMPGYNEQAKNDRELLDHVQEMELVTVQVQDNLSLLDDTMKVSRAETERTHADIRSLERALDNEDYDTEGFVLPALESLWDTARKHNSSGKGVTAE
eukprot:scpid92506/ scgid13790/ 